MQTIHKVVKVVNNQVIIDMPPDFMANEVEVILKPLAHKAPGIHELEREIDIGMESPVSPRSHEEIFRDRQRLSNINFRRLPGILSV